MPTNRAYAGVALAAAAWGTWSLFLRRAGESQPIAPALATLVILSSIALILLPWAIQSTRRAVRRRTSWEWVRLGFG